MGTSVKIFKKSSLNGKILIYMNQREYVQSSSGALEDVHGVIHSDNWTDALKGGKNTVVQLMVQYKFGKDDEEQMGAEFTKQFVVDKKLIDVKKGEAAVTKFQNAMLTKLGQGAIPFTLKFPDHAPNSVVICGDEAQTPTKDGMGVTYFVKAHIGQDENEISGCRESSISMRIMKSQNVAADVQQKSPLARLDKDFIFGTGKIGLEIYLNKEYYFHGEDIPVGVSINNTSDKSVKQIKVGILQNINITTVKTSYWNKVSNMISENGCPLEPGSSLNQTIKLRPMAQELLGSSSRGLALDSWVTKNETDLTLASSTIIHGQPDDQLGVLVNYVVKVSLIFSGISMDLHLDIPFKLIHPTSAEVIQALEKEKAAATAHMPKEIRQKLFQGHDSAVREFPGVTEWCQ